MNKKNNIELGFLGEDIACQYLIENKYKIIERNYRKPWGEIDVIAKSPDKILVFVEVKTIRQYGNLEYGNECGNQQKIIRQCGNEKCGNDECGNLENKKFGNDFLPHCRLPHSKFKQLLNFFHLTNNSAMTNNAAIDNSAMENNSATPALPNSKNNSAMRQLPNYRIQYCRIPFADYRITPEMQMTKSKIKKIRRTASLYAGSHTELINEKKGWRIDLFALTISDNNYLIRYYENI